MFEIKEDLTVENILSKITDYDIFLKYCDNFKEVKKHFKSELRDDPKASCMITPYAGRLWYKDFGESNKACDAFSYVMRKYNLSFTEALNKINNEFFLNFKVIVSSNLESQMGKKQVTKDSYVDYSNYNKEVTIITINEREWLAHDLEFWKGRYKIPLKILKFYRIYPINKLWINNKEYKTDLYTYAFLINKVDGVERYKIYSPFSKKYKWLSNCKSTDYQGYDQLPWVHDKLVITKSLKDVAVLSLFKIPSIAPQSESLMLPTEFIEGLKKRFKNIYMFFDNDAAGIKGSLENSTKHNIPERFIPKTSEAKDISDYIKKYGYSSTKLLVKKLFYE
jgi:hypothetical protein